jgi:hypothetical protein
MGNTVPPHHSGLATPCNHDGAGRQTVAEDDSSHALLFLAVNSIRGTYIRLNGEELCSTANRHDVEV